MKLCFFVETVYMSQTQDMIAISKDEFISGAILPADVFIQLKNKNYILLARQGQKFAFEEMHVSEKNEIHNFFIKKEDYKKCVGQHLSIAGVVLSSTKITETKKTEFLAKTTETVFKEIDQIGFSHESLEHAKNISQNISKLVENKTDIFQVVEILSNISNEIVRHSMAVSIISIILTKELGWKLPSNIEKIALGGLLHDVGLKEIPIEIVNKPRHLLTFEERQIYETHTYRGAEILRSMPSIPDDIISIAYEHHENAIGQGYPRKLKDFKLNPLGRVVALADAFTELTLSDVNNPHPKTAAEAIEYLEVTMGQPYNKATFLALKHAILKNQKNKNAA